MSRLLHIRWCNQRLRIDILDDRYQVRKRGLKLQPELSSSIFPSEAPRALCSCNIYKRSLEAGWAGSPIECSARSSVGFYSVLVDLYVDQGLQDVTCTEEERVATILGLLTKIHCSWIQ